MPYIVINGVGNGTGAGGIVQWFADQNAVDIFFAANPNLFTPAVAVAIGDPITVYQNSGAKDAAYDPSLWVQTDISALIQGQKGDNGQNGAPGTNGTNGVGVPAGGSAGQILAKKSSSDYDTEWVVGGTGGGVAKIFQTSDTLTDNIGAANAVDTSTLTPNDTEPSLGDTIIDAAGTSAEISYINGTTLTAITVDMPAPDGVTSYNGQTGDVTGVSSLDGISGDLTIDMLNVVKKRSTTTQILDTNIALDRGNILLGTKANGAEFVIAEYAIYVSAAEFTGSKTVFGVPFTSAQIDGGADISYVPATKVVLSTNGTYYYSDSGVWTAFTPTATIEQVEFGSASEHFNGNSLDRPTFDLPGGKKNVAFLDDIPSIDQNTTDIAAIKSALTL